MPKWFYVIVAFIVVIALGVIIITWSLTRPFCANSVSCLGDLSGNYDSTQKTGIFEGQKVDIPPLVAEGKAVKKSVLGETTDAKRIEVDLTSQTLTAYEIDKPVMSFLISSGKWFKTPTGTFRIWIKVRYTRMTGGEKGTGTYYDLPNVPNVMFFYNDEFPKSQGFSLHGAYWHHNFGHPMSHGCVNIGLEDAKRLYEWVGDTQDVLVVITGTTPQE